MITGLLLGICAAFFWALTNVVDKYLLVKYSSDGNVGGLLLLSCFFPVFLIMVAFVFSHNIFLIDGQHILVLTTAGFLTALWIFFYLKALIEGDASVVMTVLVLAPLFSLVFASLILDERLTQVQLIGGLLIIIGALSVTYEIENHTIQWRLFVYGVIACMITGLMQTMFKFATIKELFWESMFWKSVGMIFFGLLLYIFVASYRNNFHYFISSHFKLSISLNSINETLTLIGDTIFAFAILFAPLALIQTTEAYQPIFVLITVFIATRLGFRNVAENFGERVLVVKFLGVFLVLIGSAVLSFTTT